jgi:hypothetical protein
MTISDPYDEFNRKVGKILQMALNTEHNLDYFIASYFVKPKRDEENFLALASEKMGFFTDIVLNRLDFETKIRIFENICKNIGSDTTKFKETLTAVRLIQTTRNKVAHWDIRRTKENEVCFVKKDYFETSGIKLKLDKELMDKLENARIKIASGITWLNMELG